MRNSAIVDSGPLIALFDRDDAHHALVVRYLADHRRLQLLSTWAVANETSALLASRVGKQAELDFLEWVERGGVAIVFADASVAVLAEHSGIAQVLTLDRDFEVYRDARGRLLKNLLAAKRVRLR